MNRQADIQLDHRSAQQGRGLVWVSFVGWPLVLCAAVAAVALLLAAESHISPAQRQQVFEASGGYP